MVYTWALNEFLLWGLCMYYDDTWTLSVAMIRGSFGTGFYIPTLGSLWVLHYPDPQIILHNNSLFGSFEGVGPSFYAVLGSRYIQTSE